MSAPADPVPDVWPPRLPHLLGQDGVRNLHGQDPVPPGHMDLRGSAQVKIIHTLHYIIFILQDCSPL